MKRVSVAVAITLVAVTSAIFYFLQDSQRSGKASGQRNGLQSSVVPTPGPSQAPDVVPVPFVASTNSRRPPPPIGKRLTIAEEYESSSSLKAFFDKYEPDWRSASPEVKAYLLRALTFCNSFVGRDDSKPHPPLMPDTAKDKPNFTQRHAAMERAATLCHGFESYQMQATMMQELRAGAMTGDDPIAVARRLTELQRTGKASEAEAAAQSLLQQPLNYEILNGLANYFSWRYRELQTGTASVQPSVALYTDAWLLVKCDLVPVCNSDSRDMTLLCWKQGICVPNYESYLASRYSPAQYDEISRIRRQIGTGLVRRDFALLGAPR